MALNQRIVTKVLIETAANTEDANEIINQYAGFMTIKENIAFLKGMFGVEIIDQKPEDSDELVYELMLHAIWAESQ